MRYIARVRKGDSLTVEIAARNDEGFSDNVVRTVSENARTLKIDPSGFEFS